MENVVTEEQIVMELIVNGGNARSQALNAIKFAKKGQIEEAENLLKQSAESLGKAHRFQTDLIQAEARGEKKEISMIMIHGQDHLMNAMTVRELAIEIVELHKTSVKKEEC